MDRVLAMAPLAAAPHVAVIGRHTLSFVLALMRHGCGCVRSLRPDAAAPDCETADLAWIVDVQDERELDDALHAAHRRTGDKGRIVLEDAACRHCLATMPQHAAKAGLEVVSFDRAHRRLLLAALHTSR
ncbi:MAG TPA: hypothetical protein VMI56_28160 [Reyranella sp.]|nr:hypothetical protein [Reyranella sp.]